VKEYGWVRDDGGCFAVVAFDMFIEHPYKYIMKYRSLVKAKECSA
jgi:hypothetical protein